MTKTVNANYDDTCEVCGQSPTVEIIEERGNVHKFGLCGVCCFGTAEALDPATWGEVESDDES